MPNLKIQNPNEIQSSNEKERLYDLGERTAKFGEDVLGFVKPLCKDNVNRILISQLIRSATSIGANYVEADGAESKKDFRHKISLCKKEAKETKHWLRMIVKANPNKSIECSTLKNEAHELTLIFSSIINKTKSKNIKLQSSNYK